MPGRQKRKHLDQLDLALVDQLKRDGRQSNVELAQQLGVSEKTVRMRVARLVTDFGLTVRAELPEAGSHSQMVYLVRCHAGQRFAMAEDLAARPEVERVHLITGAADILVAATFPDDSTALRFQVQTLETHPGVHSAQSCHLISQVGEPGSASGTPTPRIDTEALTTLMIAAQPPGSLDELTDRICQAATCLGADRALIIGPVPGRDGLEPAITRQYQISDQYLEGLAERLSSGRGGVIWRVWETHQHVLVIDARTDPLMSIAHDLVRAEGYVTLFTVPLLFGSTLVATLSLYYDHKATLNDQYIATAQSVADYFAVAIARVIGLAAPLGTGPAETSTANGRYIDFLKQEISGHSPG